MGHNFVELCETECACATDYETKQPGRPRSSLPRRRIEFDRHSPPCRNLLPLLIRRGTIEIAAARLLGEFLHLEHGNGFTCCLRHFGECGWQWSRHESFDFVSVEPDEMAQSTYIHVHSRVFGERYVDHRAPAGWAARSDLSLAADCVTPKRVD